MRNAFIYAAAFAVTGVAAHSAPVDLSTWSSPEGGGSWTIAADNNSVFQSTNTPTPTTFFSGVDSQGLQLSGSITVESSGGDDDFIGFVLGYDAGDLVDDSADYLLIDWKRGDQNAFGFAPAGLSISRVTGGVNTTEAWSHTGDVTELARGTTLGLIGWVPGQTYLFDLIFTSSLVQVRVDGVLELSVAGSFSDGSFGFYNFSQQGVRYAGLQEEIAPPVNGVVPLPAGLPLILTALGVLGLATRLRKT
ncbi:hypothetical protein SuNHUV7_40550 (plasmid) [Pseudoseohaeicola sp. NH-UV-7]|uniref:VPLPA-CTERM sorting domain-containing protein n=1 Tax=Sulfitobacter sp. TBRI5 TaxID=2989732 RepID=UPI003A71F9AC